MSKVKAKLMSCGFATTKLIKSLNCKTCAEYTMIKQLSKHIRKRFMVRSQETINPIIRKYRQ